MASAVSGGQRLTWGLTRSYAYCERLAARAAGNFYHAFRLLPRDQRRAISDVLRAVARSEGLQPVLDEIVEAAMRLCQGEHAQLYMAEGDLFVIFSQSSVSQSGDLPAAYEYSVEHPHARDRTTVIGRVALIGGAVGAAAGAAAARASRDIDIVLPKGAAVTIKLDKPLTVKRTT